jgi:hypothetical protein
MTLEKSLITFPILEARPHTLADAESLLEWQQPDSCSPAILKCLFDLSRINSWMTQSYIKGIVYDQVWDGSRPHDITEFLSWFYVNVRHEEGVGFLKLAQKLEEGDYVQVLWHDDLPEEKPTIVPESEWGHWTAVLKIDFKEGGITILDPSQAERAYDQEGYVLTNLVPGVKYVFEKRKTYKMHLKDFSERWYDKVDESGRIARQLAIFVNPADSKTNSARKFLI